MSEGELLRRGREKRERPKREEKAERKKRKEARRAAKLAQKEEKKTKKRKDDVEHEDNLQISSPYRQLKVELKAVNEPAWGGQAVRGVEELLNGMMLKYIPVLDGVLLSWDNLDILAGTSDVEQHSGHTTFPAVFDALLFSPQEPVAADQDVENANEWELRQWQNRGTRLSMTVNVQGPDHIGGLVGGLFNASIGTEGLPRDTTSNELLVEFQETGAKAVEHGAQSAQILGQWVWKEDQSCLVPQDRQLSFEVLRLNFGHDSIAMDGRLFTETYTPIKTIEL